MPNTLPLRHMPDFFQSAHRTRSKFFNFFWQPNTIGEFRYAVIVGKTISPKATVRNLVKRRATEAIKDQLKSFPTDIDLVVLPFRQVETMDLEKLTVDLNQLAAKLHQKHQ